MLGTAIGTLGLPLSPDSAAGQEHGSEFRIPVGYLVTTLEV
jgi:hypothetical protein